MYLLSCYRAPIGQGYGLTETFAGAAFSEWDDYSVGRVGPPLPCCYIKVWHILDVTGLSPFLYIFLSHPFLVATLRYAIC